MHFNLKTNLARVKKSGTTEDWEKAKHHNICMKEHNNKQQQGSDRCAFPFCETFRSSPVVDMSVHDDHGSEAAKLRRDRRLRMHWRHEQLTLQMALAAALHHSRDVGPVTYNALRSQKTARTEATNNAPRSLRNSVAGDTEFFSLRRPSPLVEVRPQDRVKRPTPVPHALQLEDKSGTRKERRNDRGDSKEGKRQTSPHAMFAKRFVSWDMSIDDTKTNTTETA